MQQRMARLGFTLILLGASTIAALGASDQAAYQQRRDTMKAMGRALYLDVGRVAKGRSQFGPDTVAAAESLEKLAATIGQLFPAGSDVPESSMKPEILASPDKVQQLVAAVQATLPGFVSEVKSGDKSRIAVAVAAVNQSCDACHSQFRKAE